jgi:hypothetical protein
MAIPQKAMMTSRSGTNMMAKAPRSRRRDIVALPGLNAITLPRVLAFQAGESSSDAICFLANFHERIS